MIFDGRFARLTRIAALIVAPPLLALAYDRICANALYSAALAYVPIIFGGIGLVARSTFDAVTDRANPRLEFSGKGAFVGSAASFFLLLVAAPQGADRTALVALFISSLAFYYAVGKAGCLFLGCCRAVVPGRFPLPAIEALWSLAIGLAALATLYQTARLRLLAFAAIVACLLALRVFSRCRRGSNLRSALGQIDSLALAALACVAAAMAWLS